MPTIPGEPIESWSPEGEAQTAAIKAREPAPYKPEMGVQPVQPKPNANPYEEFLADERPAQRLEEADVSWKDRFVRHFENAQRYGTPGVDQLGEIRDARLGYVSGVGVGPEDGQVNAEYQAMKRAEAMAAYDGMKPAESPMDYVAAIGGEVFGSLADPVSLLSPAVKVGTAGWRSGYPVLSRMLDSGVSNAAMNALLNATVQAEEWGADLRDSVDWQSLGLDAAAGFVLGAPLGAGAGLEARSFYAREAERAAAPAPGTAPMAPRVARETKVDLPADLSPASAESVTAEFTPAELQQAQETLFGEVVGTRNLTPEQLTQVDDYLNAGRAGDIPQAKPETEGGLTNEDVSVRGEAQSQSEPVREMPLAGQQESISPPSPIPFDRTERQFAPSELKVDAKRFQFKEGGDDAGVTDRLKGVKKWDNIKSGVTLVWEDLKGDFYIADGHQRHGLATRLEKEGQQPKIRAVVLREADGVTAEDARAIAASKNIAEGTGNAIDAAKILRSRPDMGVDLPPSSALVRDAQGLAGLSDDAFGMVVNKKVPAGYAAMVGRMAPDKNTHTELLGLLAKEQPDNAIEAESMIRDALEAPAVQSTMEDMFGSAQVTQILFKERAQVLSAAATAIRKDRAAFATLVREEARLTGAGNRLATQTNAERATQDAEILATLQATARRKGPVADALAAAAKRLNDGESRQAVVRDFLDSIRGSGATARADGRGAGQAGREGQEGIAARLDGTAFSAPRQSGPGLFDAPSRVDALEAEYRAAKSAADDAYWAFTRRTNPGKSVVDNMSRLSKEANDARTAWMNAKRAEEAGADGKPQAVLPGAERVSDKTLAERKAAAPLKAGKAQKGMDFGLFGDDAAQQGFSFRTDAVGTGLPDLVARGAPIEEIAAHPFIQDAVRRMDAVPRTDKQPGYMSRDWKAKRAYDFPDGEVVGYDNAVSRLTDDAKKFSADGPVKNEGRAIIILGPPAAGKSMHAEGIAKARFAAIVDPDEAKKVIPEFEGGIGANAVHEESAEMASDVMTRLMDENANMVIPKVGGNEAGIRKLVLALQGQGYRVDLVGMNVTYDNAFRRMVGRFLKTGRLINPAYVEDVGVKPSATYRTLREQGVADGYAEIDGNGAIGEIPRLLDDGGALDGVPGYGRGVDGNLSPQAARAAGAVEDAPAAGVAFSAARPQPRSPMPVNRPQAGTPVASRPKVTAPRIEDISADLRALTGAPVRQGRLQRAPAGAGKVAGQYDRGQGVIRMREMADFETQTHETAHSLETEWGRDLNTIKLANRAELEPMAYAGADPRQQLSEGFAEWFRFYVTSPNYARTQAPQFTQAFEAMLQARAPEQLASLQAITQAYRQHVTAPSQAVVAADVVSTRKGGLMAETIKEARKNGWRASIANYASEGYTTFIDKLNPINRAVDELAKLYEKRTGQALNITSAQDPYRLARLLQDSYSAGHIDAMYGVVPYQGVTSEGPALADALSRALGDQYSSWDDELMADFASYLISRRAVKEYDRYLAGEIPNPPGKFTRGDYETALAELEAAHPEWIGAADMVYAWQKNLLKKKKDSGFITQDLYDELIQREDYVPFMRDLTDLEQTPGAAPNRTLRDSIMKAFKGSKRSIINPIESMLADAYHFNALMRRNDVFKAMDDLARMAGPGAGRIIERIPSTQLKGTKVDVNEVLKIAAKEAGLNPSDVDHLTTMVDDMIGENANATVFRAGEINEKGEPIIYVWRNGKKQALRLADGEFGRSMYDAMTGMNKEARDLFVNILAVPSTVMRYAITTHPPFVLANYIRDQVSAWVLTGNNFIPFISGAKGLRDEVMQREITQIYNTFGGIMGGGNVASLDKGRAMRDIRALQKKGYAVKRFASYRGFAEFTELTETGTRLAVFKNAFDRAKKDGLNDYEAAVEGAFQSRDYIDFGRHGSRTHAARRLVTFLNASLQGLDKTIRTLTAEGAIRKAIAPYINSRSGRPLSARDKQNLAKSASAWAKLTALGVFGLGLSYLYADDPEYEEISDYVRATHWMVKKGPGEWYAIPKPFELGFVSNLFERGFDAVYGRNPIAMQSFLSGLYEVTAPPMGIPLFETFYQLQHNTDAFGRPIVSQDMAGFEPWAQYNAQTSEIAKQLGKAVNISPALIDHAIQGFGASWGRSVTDMSRDIAQERGVFASIADSMSRRFIRDVTAGAVSSRQFWDLISESGGGLAAAGNTYKNLFENQGEVAADAFLQTKSENEKAFALLTTHFEAKVERLHPMRRAKDMISVISSLRKDLAGNDVKMVDDEEARIALSPDIRRGAQDALARLAMVEARNALITIGEPGWAQKPYMDAESLLRQVGELSPELGEELTARIEKKKIYDDATVRENWPEVKSRVLEDRQDADFSDLLAGVE